MKKFIKLIFFGLVFISSVDAAEREVELNNLFKKLRDSEVIEAKKIEKRILEIWSTHPSNDRKGYRLTSLLAQGSFLIAKKELYKAHEIFSQIILIDPKWPEAWNKRATVYFFLGMYEESQDDINNVLKLEKRHFGALSGQGMVQNELKNFIKALESFKLAQKIYPSMESPKVMIPLLKELTKGLKT
jgi:tetratricopeptide (TPR) repeat protein